MIIFYKKRANSRVIFICGEWGKFGTLLCATLSTFIIKYLKLKGPPKNGRPIVELWNEKLIK
jgi:hypothetical protein